MQQLNGIKFVTIYALGPINVWLSGIYAILSPSACYMSRPSRLWCMHINIFNNSSKYLPPPIRSTAKRKHRYKYYIINTVCTTLSTRFSETFAVFSEGYNTPLTLDNSFSH